MCQYNILLFTYRQKKSYTHACVCVRVRACMRMCLPVFQMPAACSEIVGDIEDLISSQDITPKERYSNKRSVTVRVRRRPSRQVKHEQDVEEYAAPSSIIPGTQTVYIKTWGCTHNSSDSEYMAGLLAAYGYNLTG